MLVVKVEIHPGGDESRARELAYLEIANVSDLADLSDYQVAGAWTGSLAAGGQTYGRGQVQGYPRRLHPVLQLVAEALGALGFFSERS